MRFKGLRKLFTLLIAVIAISAVFTACVNPGPAGEEDPAVLESLRIVSAPTRTLYVAGDTFEKAGLKVEAVFDKGDNVDVTDSLSIPTTPLIAGQTSVAASYTHAGGGGGTKSINIDVRVISGPPGDADAIMDIGETDLTLASSIAATQQSADSYWYISYGEETVDITVLVKDSDIKFGSSVWSSDSVVIYLAKVERARQVSEGTLRLVIPAKGLSPLMQIYTAGEWESLDAATVEEITCAVNNKVGFDEEYDENESYIDGYKINLSVPYACLNGVDLGAKNLSVLPGLINSNGSLATEKYSNALGAQYEKTHTYIAVADDLDYEENYWIYYGAAWGSAGANLQAKDAWYTEDDDGVTNTIKTGAADSWITNRDTWGTYGDSEIYMYRNNSTRLYAEMEFNAVSSYDNANAADTGYGKFGISVTSANGAESIFFYVDAINTGSRTNFTGNVLGYNIKSGGSWGGSWAGLTSIEGGAADYTGANYIKMGVYRQGDLFGLYYYRNGVREIIGVIKSGIGADEPAYVGISTFKININVKEYSVTSDPSVLADMEIAGSAAAQLNDFEDAAGWKQETDYVENNAVGEQAVYFKGVNQVSFYAQADIWVGYGGGKVGLTLKGDTKEFFYFIDVNGARNNNWGNYWIRNIGAAWSNAGEPRDYKNLRTVSYNKNYKTLAVMKVGNAIYCFADGELVMYAKDIFGADENVTAGVMSTGLNIRVADAISITDPTLLAGKMTEKGIGETSGISIDGNLSDWTAEQKGNPRRVAASNGRVVTIYAHTNTDGLYIGADALHNNYKTDGAWFEATNIEFKIGTPGQNNQRYASANGQYSRWETGGNRDVGLAKFTSSTEDPFKHTFAEIFIPWGMIEGFDASSPAVPIGFAWKTQGETGLVWEKGSDFWYYPEGDPGMRNQNVTANGFATGADLAIDGNADDWNGNIMDTKMTGTAGDRDWEMCAFLGTDGMYMYLKITAANAINTAVDGGEWFQYPDIEMKLGGNDQYKVIIVNDLIVTRGRFGAAAYSLSNDDKTIEFELFIPYNTMHASFNSSSTINLTDLGIALIGGGFTWLNQPAVAVTATGLPTV